VVIMYPFFEAMLFLVDLAVSTNVQESSEARFWQLPLLPVNQFHQFLFGLVHVFTYIWILPPSIIFPRPNFSAPSIIFPGVLRIRP
jgi:hypothetical protein